MGFFGASGGGGGDVTVYTSWSDLPASGGAGEWAFLEGPQVAVRYDNTASQWRPAELYELSLTEVLKLNVADLSLDNADPVTSWGGLSQGTASLQPTYNDTGGPEGGAWVDFAGDRLTGATTALGGARYVNVAAVVKADNASNRALFAFGDSVTVLQLQLFSGVRFFTRTQESLSAGTAIVSSTAPTLGEWSIIVAQFDYTDATAKALMGGADDFERTVPVPLVRSGEVSMSGMGGAGTIETGEKDVTVGNNVSNATPWDGGLAHLGVWTTASALTAAQLEALGQLAWMEATG